MSTRKTQDELIAVQQTLDEILRGIDQLIAAVPTYDEAAAMVEPTDRSGRDHLRLRFAAEREALHRSWLLVMEHSIAVTRSRTALVSGYSAHSERPRIGVPPVVGAAGVPARP